NTGLPILIWQCHTIVLSFFFSTLRPPPTFTLFPYTTLFRSSACHSASNCRSLQSCCIHPRCNWPASRILFRPDRSTNRAGCPGEDRKSTRLNSSHSQISYAVFCLKKKN